ncbi:IS110 family transposase [Cohnella herbarum]|uniref:IS110 family transposase n=1 Tax=Cohnella herbarum TaxID=2728023 RepID=A0A7Z2VPE1_9BACL|nr:IS110 family transposase [Cohnella herbarum]QJD86654.1 IS110 family transposase [Cohnella herbarum]
MDALRITCAGLDVHQKTVVACILTGPIEGKPKTLIQTFGTTTKELLQLQDWLAENNCTEAAMESTGVLWKPVWNVLESTCKLVLANPQHIKNLPGRKTDVKDAQWIAQLHRCGLIEPSMVATREIRELRDKTRYRRKLVQQSTSEKNRVHKILQDANIKLTTYMSDLFGVSGRALLEKLIDGEVLEEDTVRDLVKNQLKKKVNLLMDALNGKLLYHHREMIKYHMEHLKFLEDQIGRLEENIQVLVKPYQEEVKLLDSIPGIDEIAATTLMAEISPNAANYFSSDAKLASWVGVCPGNNESAGVKKTAKSRKGNNQAKGILCQAAWANSVHQNRIGEYFRRIRKRRGEQKAAVATAHLLLRIAYALLKNRVEYAHLEQSFFQIPTEKMTERLTKQLQQLGYQVELKLTGTQ